MQEQIHWYRSQESWVNQDNLFILVGLTYCILIETYWVVWSENKLLDLTALDCCNLTAVDCCNLTAGMQVFRCQNNSCGCNDDPSWKLSTGWPFTSRYVLSVSVRASIKLFMTNVEIHIHVMYFTFKSQWYVSTKLIKMVEVQTIQVDRWTQSLIVAQALYRINFSVL